MSHLPTKRAEAASLLRIDAAGIGVCVAGALMVYFVGVEPRSRAIEARRAQEAEVEAQEDHVSKLRVAGQGIERRLAEAKRAIVASHISLDGVDQVNTRVAALTQMAGASGLRLDEIKPGMPLDQEKLKKVPIRLAGTGSYAACVGFVRELRSRLPDTGVTGLELYGQPGAPQTPATFVFDLAWYAAPEGGPGVK